MMRYVLAASVLALSAGCDQRTFPEHKVEAEKRWFKSRAKVLYRVADNAFAGGKLDRALHAVNQAMALDPDFHDAKLLLARVHIGQGRHSEGAKLLRNAMAREPDCAKTAYLLGVALERGGNLEDALASYRRAHGLAENDLAPVKAAAEVLVAMGRVREAELSIESHLSKAGEDAGMYELAGRLAMMGKDYARAAEMYQRARDLDYQNVRYMECLARARHAAEQYADAADTLDTLLTQDGYEPPTWVLLLAGDCRMVLGRAREAFDAYYTAAEQAPEKAPVWRSLSRSALAMRDAERAVQAARKAIHLEPGHVDGLLLLGYGLLRADRPGEAVAALTRAAAAHPSNGTIHCLLGRAHAMRGNEVAAVRCYRQALKVDPDNALARALLAEADGGKLTRADP